MVFVKKLYSSFYLLKKYNAVLKANIFFSLCAEINIFLRDVFSHVHYLILRADS